MIDLAKSLTNLTKHSLCQNDTLKVFTHPLSLLLDSLSLLLDSTKILTNLSEHRFSRKNTSKVFISSPLLMLDLFETLTNLKQNKKRIINEVEKARVGH